MKKEELLKMIVDYMEKGFLENIIDMFKHDPSLYELVGEMIKDERVRVRIGTVAMMEELAKERPEDVKRAIPHLLSLLKDENPTVRGDGAYLLALSAGRDALPWLRELLNDPSPQVRETVKEVIEEIERAS